MYDLFGNLVTTQNRCKVTIQGNALRITTPYNPQFVTLIKSLPPSARRFDPNTKAWLVATQYGGQIRKWIMQVYGEDIGDMAITQAQPKIETRILDVWYLGRTKPSGDEFVASGMNAKQEWAFIFPESALKLWFEGITTPTLSTTLYGILGVKRDANSDELKTAYRRMVRQWHPDVCREQNAQEIFIQIQNAYEILSDPVKRAKYDAGLALEATIDSSPVDINSAISGYRSPLRCGYVLAEGYEQLNRFVVTKIIDWQDIISDNGVLVASWNIEEGKPSWIWAWK